MNVFKLYLIGGHVLMMLILVLSYIGTCTGKGRDQSVVNMALFVVTTIACSAGFVSCFMPYITDIPNYAGLVSIVLGIPMVGVMMTLGDALKHPLFRIAAMIFIFVPNVVTLFTFGSLL